MYLILYNSWINLEVCFSNRKRLCYSDPLHSISFAKCYYVKALSMSKTLVRPNNILDLHSSSYTWWCQLIYVCQSIFHQYWHGCICVQRTREPNAKIHSRKYHSMKRLWCFISTKIEVTLPHIHRLKLDDSTDSVSLS